MKNIIMISSKIFFGKNNVHYLFLLGYLSFFNVYLKYVTYF